MAMSMPNNAPVSPMMREQQTMYPQRTYFPGMPTPHSSNLPGYYIQDESEIVVKYIPQDGSIAFYPFKDLSKIVIKQWDANGLNSLTYILDKPATPSQSQQTSTEDQQTSLVMPSPPAQQANPIADAFSSLQNGLANTFNQFGSTLQTMQDEISMMNQNFKNLINSGEFGGKG